MCSKTRAISYEPKKNKTLRLLKKFSVIKNNITSLLCKLNHWLIVAVFIPLEERGEMEGRGGRRSGGGRHWGRSGRRRKGEAAVVAAGSRTAAAVLLHIS